MANQQQTGKTSSNVNQSKTTTGSIDTNRNQSKRTDMNSSERDTDLSDAKSTSTKNSSSRQ